MLKVNYIGLSHVGQASCKTELASYLVEYTFTGSELQTVRATVSPPGSEMDHGGVMGVLEYCLGTVNSYNFPYSPEYARIIEEFVAIVEDVKKKGNSK